MVVHRVLHCHSADMNLGPEADMDEAVGRKASANCFWDGTALLGGVGQLTEAMRFKQIVDNRNSRSRALVVTCCGEDKYSEAAVEMLPSAIEIYAYLIRLRPAHFTSGLRAAT